jgi:hypothetical protein
MHAATTMLAMADNRRLVHASPGTAQVTAPPAPAAAAAIAPAVAEDVA